MSGLLDQLVERLAGATPLKKNPQHEAKRQLSWIKDCLESHYTCRSEEKSSFVPARLVDVRNLSSICLVNANALVTSDRRFVALSYCWGDSMPDSGRTTLSSLKAHQQKIDPEKLPKTLREAIEVTRSLSIPYIWIDALCIIQDDKLDWEREIETMAQVYSCATVTVAAGVSDHCDGGFLMSSRPPFRPFTKPRRAKTVELEEDNDWRGPFFDSPLFSRGWTLQERELSLRVLHFTATNIVFECRQGIRRYEVATAKDYFPSMPLEHKHSFFSDPDQWAYRIFDDPPNRQKWVRVKDLEKGRNWHGIWWKSVAEYSERRFTDPTDRLPAIAGLADMLQKTFKWNYIVGLWKENLALDLLWQTKYVEVTEAAAAYIAPSWSWASARCPIQYNHLEIGMFGDPVIEIIEAKVQPAGTNSKGKVSGGYLKVRGRMKTLVGEARTRADDARPGNQLLRTYYVEGSGDIWVYWDRECDIEASEDLAILLLIFTEEGMRCGAGLALQKTDVKGEYRRVGLATYIRHEFIEDAESVEVLII